MTGLSLSLPPVSTAGRLARAAVRDHFTDALNRNTVADLELVISELVANSVEHGRGTIQLSVERSIAAIQGSVTDDGDGFAYTPPDFSSHAPRGGWAGDCRRRRHELGHPPRQHASLVRNHPQRESTDRPVIRNPMPDTRSQPLPTHAAVHGSSASGTDHGRRLSPVDGSFLRLESPQSHMHVGFSTVFAAPSGGPRPSVEALRERAAGRLHEVPWCRWRLDPAPLGLSEPRWIDDDEFDLAAHIVALTQPEDRVSHARFEALRSSVLSAPLDRSRPLWQISLVPQLEDGRVGMVGKIHHALVDGLAALQIVNLILDPERDVASQPPVDWQPRGRPGRLGWALDAAAQTFAGGVGALRAGATAATHPPATVANALRDAKRVLGAAAEGVLSPAPSSALNAPIGARRTLVGYHARRDELRAARRGGGTLNDVGLAAVAGAVRALLQLDGEPPPPEPLKAMVPVSMRRLGDTAAGNQISMITIALPVHLDSATERLDWVREQTERLKQTDRPIGTQKLYQAAGLLPTPLRSPAAKAMATPRQFNLTVSQSPAPRGSLYLLGCELQEVYSVVPITQGHALAIGMVRYRQELFFGCYADPDALPEIHRLPALIETELQQLGHAARSARQAAG